MNWKSLNTDGWTLFLDRDGTLNRNIKGDYVRNTEQFEWLPGALDALRVFAKHFPKIIVLTNQQGIGKGLMTMDDLNRIHELMLDDVKKAAGRIDAIYSCPHLAEDNCGCRKPRTGLALQAKRDFPEIDFLRSIVAGDKTSDIALGKVMGAMTVLLGSGERPGGERATMRDFEEDDLREFALRF